jgi:peptidoglycan/xylan/chitin deacetylase (PgdA/CDA1 family)
MSYDTEAIYPWWELGEQPYSARLYRESVRYEGRRKEECLDGIRAVAAVHLEHNFPATFFLVAELVQNAAPELRSILDKPLFDIQCHSYSHENLMEIADSAPALKREIVDSKKLIEDAFSREVTGFTTPGSFTTGLVGQKRQIALLWEAGYRYVRSVGKGSFDTCPAPLTQPFWYAADGFPELLELGLHGWHDNILSGQPFLTSWPPIFPWGYPSRMPTNAREMYDVYAPFLEHVARERLLTYVPCFHPWSIFRVDSKALHIELLLTHARRIMDVVSCTDIDRKIRDEPDLVVGAGARQ